MNEAQQHAIETRVKNVLVSAGAGSGKTRVLTNRYLHLLTNGLDGKKLRLDEILTLTFTRKAAQEMRERIARMLDDEGRLFERRELSRAPIGTIHSFCESVLREHALAAGIDPNFRMLDDAEARTLQEGALDAVFEDLWAGTQQEREEIGRLVLAIPQRTLRSALMTIFGAARTRGLSVTDIPLAQPLSLSSAAASLANAVEELLQLEGTAKWKANLADVATAFDELRPQLATTDTFSWDTYYQVQQTISRLTPRGGPKELATQCRRAITRAAEQWLGAYLDLDAQHSLMAFRTLLIRFEKHYRAAKDAQGLLDFEDLLLCTRALLTQDDQGSASRLRQQYRQIMVDEFQDTNPLQFSIIQALQGDDHLFMVGDVKQAIYRFIGSDINVFLQQEQRIAQLGDAGIRIPMHINYRTRPEVLQPLNGLFARLWSETSSDGFTFEPLSPGIEGPEKAVPSVEFAIWHDDEGSSAELRDREARWIARRILQLTDAQQDDPAKFGDIMILFRASTTVPLYEDALRSAGIPYYVVSGRGFYTAREVQDILYLLRVLENPMDDFALAIVLRSPLVAVSDDALYWLTRDWSDWEPEAPLPVSGKSSRAYGRIWECIAQVERICAITERDRAALHAFRELVLDLQQLLPAGQPLDLIDLIIARTEYAHVLLAMENGAQRFANIQKLREVAAKFQSRDILDLSDFQRYLTQLSEQAPREASAPLDVESGNVVRLMTIHASKGLEAPIVLLADCGHSPVGINDHFLLTDDGLSCKVISPEDNWEQPLAFQQAAATTITNERREAERLLYVALTRAKDHLICSGHTSFPRPEKRKHYMDLLIGLLGLDGPVAEDTDRPIPFADSAYPVRIWSPDSLYAVEQLTPPTQSATLWDDYSEAILTGADLPLLTNVADIETYAQINDRFQPLPTTRRDGPLRIGVHRALCYHACPRQYWFRYVLQRDEVGSLVQRLDETDDQQFNAGDDDAERLDGTEFGKLLHAVMQYIDFTLPLQEQLPGILTRLAEDGAFSTTEADVHHLEKCLTRFADMPIAAKLAHATRIYRELRFLARQGNVYVPGIIDVLAEIDGAWWILDYKTGQYPSADHMRQLALYALGVEYTHGATPARVCLAYVDARHARNYREEAVTPVLLDEARRLITVASEGISADRFSPTSGHHCTRCQFHDACPECEPPRTEPPATEQLRFEL